MVEMVGEGKLGRKSGAGFYVRLTTRRLPAEVPITSASEMFWRRAGFDLLPGQLGIGELIPAGQVEGFQGL